MSVVHGHMGWHHNWRYLIASKLATCICKIFGQVAPLVLVRTLATSWHHLHWLEIWPPGGATCICMKFVDQVAPLVLVRNSATRWRHLHWLEIWSPGFFEGIKTRAESFSSIILKTTYPTGPGLCFFLCVSSPDDTWHHPTRVGKCQIFYTDPYQQTRFYPEKSA